MVETGGKVTGEPLPEAAGGDLSDATRRKFMHRMLNMSMGLWVSAATLGTGYVAGRYMWPHPEGTSTGGERSVSFALADLDNQPMVRVLVEGAPVGVFRHEGAIYALGLVCTHLGCLVNREPDSGNMACPCHASRFDRNGGVISGPAPAPLKRYDVRVSGDTVLVS